MIWIIAYLVVGLCLALYLPGARSRTLERAKDIPRETLAAMSDDERRQLTTMLDSMATPYKTHHLVIAGLLWPTQIVGWIVAEVMSKRLRRRLEAAHRCAPSTSCTCPGCGKDLVTTDGVDCTENADDESVVRFVCPCGAASEWYFGAPLPLLIRNLTVADPDEPGTDARD